MVTPCAGNLVGTWFYTAACADDPLSDYRSLCPTLTTVSSNITLSGRVDFTSTTVTRQATTNYSTTVFLPTACVYIDCATTQSVLQSTAPGATCVVSGTGCNCTISGTSTLSEAGTYTASNGTINVTTSGGGTRTFASCVTSGTTPTMTFRETTATSGLERGTSTLTKQ